jgi:IPT/TIG domain.
MRADPDRPPDLHAAKGTYTGVITISDPNAVDAPQTITVTVQVGGVVPDRVDLFAATGGTPAESRFTTNSLLKTTVTTQSGGPFLAIALEGSGSFQFPYPYKLTANPSGLAAGTYNGTVVTSGSALSNDNKTIPVTLTVTSQPIAQFATDPVRFRIAQNAAKQTQFVAIGNRGFGTLTISGATATTTPTGTWLTADKPASFGGVSITADVNGLAPGVYQGSVAVASNAANPVTIPVQLEVIASGPPRSFYSGVANNATFDATDVISQGDIVAVFGEQFTTAAPLSATALPLPTDLNGTRVLVNGQPAPIYYSSYGQINFQVPYNAALGNATIRVDRDGQPGNSVSVPIVKGAPRLLRLGIKDYGIIVNQDGSFPMPATQGLASHPAKAGDALTIYAIGLGPTNPAAATGAGAPAAEPLARVAATNRVFFGGGLFSDTNVETKPLFVGLTPNFVGLYQINVVVPPEAPKGSEVRLLVGGDDGASNSVTIAIQ